MKIGILTVPFNNNYGGYLQAYALTTVLRQMGHEVVVINRRRNLSLKTRIRKLLSFGVPNKNERIIEKISKNTRKFVSDNLHITSPIYSSRSLRRECERQQFDCFIVGSDQVWRYRYAKKSIGDYFFGFLDSNDDIPRFSYAASFGVDYWEYPKEIADRCNKYLKKFKSVSVREESAVTLIEQNFPINPMTPVVVADPTILLEQTDYRQLTSRCSIDTKCRYIFKYVLDEADDVVNICSLLKKQLGLPYREVKAQTGDLVKLNVIEPVEKWLAYIANAEFVITDSYHGSVFSILFNRPFVVVANNTRGITRIKHLLCHYNLTERMITAVSAGDIAEVVNTSINWSIVNKQIQKDRTYSVEFLKNSLSL